MNTQYVSAWKVGIRSLLLIGLLVATMVPAEVVASGTSGFVEEETIPFGLRSAITRTLARDVRPEYRVAGSSAQEAKLTAGDGEAGDFFGISVAFEGNTALVGAINATVDGNDNQGAVYVFTYSDGTWSEQVKLTASDGAANDRFGAKLALSNDTAVIGAWGVTVDGNSDQGAAYVFTRSDNAWSEQAKLVATDGASGNRFGESLALMNDTVLVGVARALVDGNVLQGAAYVFARDGGIWSEQAKLTASDGASMAWFGASVALLGDDALIGSNRATVDGNALQGAAYVFTRSGDDWDEQAKLTASDGAATQLFGNSVALSHDTALIGAPLVAVDGNSNQGAAYVFTRTGEDWAEQTKLTASDGAASDQFGLSLDIHDDTALVAASFADVDGMINRGAAYVFTRSDEVWSEQTKLTASDGAAGDRFAVSVAFFDATALIGAQQADVNGNINQGAAYAFVFEDGEPGSSVLGVDPETVDFGEIAIGDSADSQTVTLSSIGTAPVEVGAIDDAVGPFARTGGDCDPVPFTLDPSESCTLEYTFAPTESGNFDQTLNVSSDADPVSFELTGEGIALPVPPQIQVDPEQLAVALDVGDATTETLTIGNLGEVELDWQIIEDSGGAGGLLGDPVACTLPDWLDANPKSGTLGEDEEEDINVDFSTAGLEPGEHTASLCIGSNDPVNPLVVVPVTLNVGEAPPVPGELEVAPESLDFGQVMIGDDGALNFAVSNIAEAGAEAIVPSVIDVSAGTPAFAVTGGTCEAGTTGLGPGESCTVEVTFAPDTEGAFSGSVSVETADAQSATVALSGAGTALPPAVLAVDPASLDFDEINIGHSAALNLTVSNAAEAPAEVLELILLEITTGGAVFEITGGDCALGTELEPGESCMAQITFSPASEGDFDGLMTVGSTDGQTVAVSLEGRAMDPGDAVFRDRFEEATD